jgi:electron transfer flavoprotein beta subunit
MSIYGIVDVENVEIPVWGADDIGVDATMVGLKSSPTNVFKSFTMKPKEKGIMVEGDTPKEAVGNLLGTLKDSHII